MKYNLWIDEQAAGPFDVYQLTELFLNGAITPDTQIRPDGGEQTEAWKRLGTTFPSITALQTRSDTAQILCSAIRSLRDPVPHAQRVTVADFDMSFGSMVSFMIRWAFATIPAAIVLAIPFLILMKLLR